MYGTQADKAAHHSQTAFENDVKMYGTQANPIPGPVMYPFENDVKMYGTQAVFNPSVCTRSLRMM